MSDTKGQASIESSTVQYVEKFFYDELATAIKELRAKHERVIEAHDFQVKLNKELQNLLKQAQPEVEKLNSQLEIAERSLKRIANSDAVSCLKSDTDCCWCVAEDAIMKIESLK